MFLRGIYCTSHRTCGALFNLGLLAEILYGRRNYIFLYLIAGFGRFGPERVVASTRWIRTWGQSSGSPGHSCQH